MLILFRMKYVVLSFVIGFLFGMYQAFSVKGCGDHVITSVPPMNTAAPLLLPGPQR